MIFTKCVIMKRILTHIEYPLTNFFYNLSILQTFLCFIFIFWEKWIYIGITCVWYITVIRIERKVNIAVFFFFFVAVTASFWALCDNVSINLVELKLSLTREYVFFASIRINPEIKAFIIEMRQKRTSSLYPMRREKKNDSSKADCQLLLRFATFCNKLQKKKFPCIATILCFFYCERRRSVYPSFRAYIPFLVAEVESRFSKTGNSPGFSNTENCAGFTKKARNG